MSKNTQTARAAVAARHHAAKVDAKPDTVATPPAARRHVRKNPPPPNRFDGVEKLLYRLDEGAHALGCGRSTIYKMLRAGELVAVKRGNHTCITAESLRRKAASLPPARFKPAEAATAPATAPAAE